MDLGVWIWAFRFGHFDLGVSIDCGLTFVHFKAFVTGMDSFEGDLNPEKPSLNTPIIKVICSGT